MSRPLLLLSLLLVLPTSARGQVLPHRSFQRLVTGNGHVVASYDRTQKKLDFLLEHPYRFAHPRADAADLCFAADESRDLLYDSYFGVRTPTTGEWTNELPLDDAGYAAPGRIHVTQHGGAWRALRIETDIFAPFGYDGAALVMSVRVLNEASTPVDVAPYALFNFHIGAAAGGREPSADAEQVSWDAPRGVFYEFSDASQGTIAYVPLSGSSHATASTGGASAFNALHARADLDDVRATTGPTSDVAPGLEGAPQTLAPLESTTWAVAIVWALDEDAGPKVDALRAWAAGRPAGLVQAYDDEWRAWFGGDLSSTDGDEALLRMAQVREPGPGHGQILASLPPAFGDPSATWNISWVRDMTYATVALARTGHLQEAHDALAFMVHAGPGRHTAEVGMPYRISVTRYFGEGAEESDCNSDGPNIEFDGFGLFLWALDEYARAGGDMAEVRAWFPTVRDEIADVLVSLIGPDGVIVPDSSIWEVHWNGKQRRFTYTSLAAARGLCSAAAVATMLGETGAATRWGAAGARVRDAVVARHTDGHSVLAQSAEDLLAGHGYLDASAVEAINWGIVDPNGRTARATLAALRENLSVASGHGLMRNDDGGFYDSQEWVFIDERTALALLSVDPTSADALHGWVQSQAQANDGLPSELYDPATGDYGGSPPMIGFGAAATVLARSGPSEPACGAYAREPLPPLVDAGVADSGAAGDAASADAGSGGKGGCGCVAAGARGVPTGLLSLLTFVLLLLFRRNGPRAAALMLLFVGCGDDPDVHRDAGLDAAVRDGAVSHVLCPITLTYRETRAVPMVHAAGDWNAFSQTADRLVDDGTGSYSIHLALSPGVHAYKLYVEGDGADPWRFDPGNPYRTYFGSAEENSGLRVPDCRLPGLTVLSAGASTTGNTFAATLRYEARLSPTPGTVVGELRSDSGATRRPLTAAELTTGSDGTIQVLVGGLTSGQKYTVEVAPVGADGTRGDDVVLPFWSVDTPPHWHDAVVYMIMTDRYRNGDPSNDGSAPDAAPGAGWEGGDYQGITQSIDDGTIDALGVNTLWISPFNTNPTDTFLDSDGVHHISAYHGYWPTEPRAVDARFGGASALHTLIAHAHQHGIRVLMDLVVNHVHEQHPYFRDHPDWFNTGCVCGTSGCDWTAHRLDCLFQPYLPDINWTVPAANEQFVADALWWMEEFDLDGFRVDAVKHVADSAITNLGTRVRERFETAGTPVFLMGETAMGWDSSAGPDAGGNVENYGTIRRYLGPHGLTGQFDFPLYYAASLSFASDTPGRTLSHVEYWTLASQREFGAAAIMTPYVGSHDTSRFLTLTADPSRAGNKWSDLPTAPSTDEPYDRMYLALAWLMAIPGAPLLYYGDEYGEFGGADPDNRHMWRPRAILSAREQRQLDRVSALLHGRSRARLGPGPIRTVQVSDDLWAFASGESYVVLNRGTAPATVALPMAVSGPISLAYADVLTDTPYAIDRNAVTVTVGARSAVYLALSPFGL